MACLSCLSVSLPACPPFIIVNGGLDANTRYRWELTDKFDKVYNGITDTDATGLLAINIADNPDIPKGLFMSFSGSFILKAYKYLSAYEIEDVQFEIGEANYDCAELKFRDYLPGNTYFNPDAPVYVPPPLLPTPIEVDFVNQTSVTVTHDLGYKPFLWVEDTLGNIIGCDVQHTSNNEFVVMFDSPTSGTIFYR